MDFELSVAQKELQARARALAETHMAPRAAEIDRTEAYPWDNVERLRAAGLLGMTIAKELGGAGLGYFEAVLAIEEMAKHCGASARIVVETNMGAIGATFGQALGTPCVTNVWIPDGSKDTPVDRKGPRQRLAESLDAIFAEPIDPRYNRDAVEGKLFGIGSESYVVGSHEFYLGYAVSRRKLLCLDAGHYHPTEVLSDKISSVLAWLDEVLLHVSRGVRWDSDHVVTLTDELQAIAQELVRGDYLDRVHIGLDYFDASINRVAAWVIGTRCTLKALLLALLEPAAALRQAEAEGDTTGRLALLEETKTLPLGGVWDYYCLQQGVPVGADWLAHVKRYEREVLARRG